VTVAEEQVNEKESSLKFCIAHKQYNCMKLDVILRPQMSQESDDKADIIKTLMNSF
jgi:hypothetical protein